jgi:hypothetical protein
MRLIVTIIGLLLFITGELLGLIAHRVNDSNMLGLAFLLGGLGLAVIAFTQAIRMLFRYK